MPKGNTPALSQRLISATGFRPRLRTGSQPSRVLDRLQDGPKTLQELVTLHSGIPAQVYIAVHQLRKVGAVSVKNLPVVRVKGRRVSYGAIGQNFSCTPGSIRARVYDAVRLHAKTAAELQTELGYTPSVLRYAVSALLAYKAIKGIKNPHG